MNAKSLLLATLISLAPLCVGARASVQVTEAIPTSEAKAAKDKLPVSPVTKGSLQSKGAKGAKGQARPKKHSEKGPKAEGEDDKDCEPGSSAEDRWKGKTEAERKVLLERFEALRRLSPEDIETLKLRAAELATQREGYEAKLAPELRDELRGLPPREHDRILRDHQLGEHRRAGEELRASLDEQQRDLVERVFRPQDGHPPRPFHSMREEMRIQFGDKVVRRFGELGQLTPEQETRLLGMTGSERMLEALHIKRKRIEECVVAVGLPEGVTQAKWGKMSEETSVERFLKQARKSGFDEHLGLADPEFDRRRGRDGQDDNGFPGRGDGPPNNPGAQKGANGPNGPKGPDGPRAPGSKGQQGNPKGSGGKAPKGAPPQSAKDLEVRELGNLLRPTLADRLKIQELPFEQRRAEMDRLLRERATGFLKDRSWFPKQELQSLKALDDIKFIKSIHDFVHEHRGLTRPRGGEPKDNEPRRERPGREREGGKPSKGGDLDRDARRPAGGRGRL
jgi:hypothetical protein